MIGFDKIQVEKTPAGSVVTLKIKERLDKGDYETFVPMIERQIESGEPVRLLVELDEFEGWTAGALWEDTKFTARNFKDIKRLAVVGDSKWQKGLTLFFKPFTGAEVRYFDMQAIDSARQWVRQP